MPTDCNSMQIKIRNFLNNFRSLTHSTRRVRDSEGSLFGSIEVHANSRDSNERNEILDDIGDYHPGLGNEHHHSHVDQKLQPTEEPHYPQKHHKRHTSERPSQSQAKYKDTLSEHPSIDLHSSKTSHHQHQRVTPQHVHQHKSTKCTPSSKEHHKLYTPKAHTDPIVLDKSEHKLAAGSDTITPAAVHKPNTSSATKSEDEDEDPLFESLANPSNETKYDSDFSLGEISREEDRAEIRAVYTQLLAEMNLTTTKRIDPRKARRKEKWAQKEYQRAMLNKHMLEMKYGKPTTREDLLREEKAWEEMVWRDGERDYKDGKFTGFDISGDDEEGDVDDLDDVSLSGEDGMGGGDYEQEEEEHRGI
uniref:Uncharacterized protein n=1 Tax=Cacopsylla melanoneura TaxID=428564 RepID=A0A8D9EX18_9HEMI